MINIKNLDPNKNKIDGKSYKNILIYYIGYVMVKSLRHVKISSANPLYLINEINGYTEESNGNKSLMLVPANENKEIMKKYIKNCGVISEILLDQTLITPMIMMKNISKSNLISMTISY